MTRSGTVFPLEPLAPLTAEIGSGSWPTPQAHDAKGGPGAGTRARGGRGSDLPSAVQRWPTPTASLHNLTEDLGTWLRRREKLRELHQNGNGVGTPLTVAVRLWRTPNASLIEAKSTVVKLSGRRPSDPQVGLADQVRAAELGLWSPPMLSVPTPTSRDYKDGSAASCANVPVNSSPGRTVRRPPAPTAKANMPSPSTSRYPANAAAQQTQAGGSLNPTWVEWLMGFPVGWTDLGPSATRSSRRS
jgi:hypothetical protein